MKQSLPDFRRAKLERLCRYVSRPAVAELRLSLTDRVGVCYSLKSLWRDGTTHVLFEPLIFCRPSGRPDSTVKGKPDAVSRRICAEFTVASADHAGPARQVLSRS